MSILKTFEFTAAHYRLVSLDGNIFDAQSTFCIGELLYLSVFILGNEVVQK